MAEVATTKGNNDKSKHTGRKCFKNHDYSIVFVSVLTDAELYEIVQHYIKH